MGKIKYIGCSVNNCKNKHWARSFCNTHYMLWRRYGDPLKRIRHPRTKYTDNICTRCGQRKPFSSFPLRVNGNRYSWCKPCSRLYSTLRKYKLNTEDFDSMFQKQGEKCLGCGVKLIKWRGNNGKWQIDHDHKCCPGQETCGKCVRGILCPTCNLALAKTSDNPLTLRNLANYLEAWGNKQ